MRSLLSAVAEEAQVGVSVGDYFTVPRWKTMGQRVEKRAKGG